MKSNIFLQSVSFFLSVISDTSNQFGIETAVPVHLEPMEEGRESLASMKENRRFDRPHFSLLALTEMEMFSYGLVLFIIARKKRC